MVEVAATLVVVGTVANIARPVVRPVVAGVVGYMGGNPDARYSLSYLGVYDESEQLLDAMGLSPEDFSKNLLADAFTELGTDAIAGAIGGAAGGYFAQGLASFRRSTSVKVDSGSSRGAERTAPELFKDALGTFKNSDLTNAGRALTKHPEVVDATKATLRQVLRTDPQINSAASEALKSILRNGVRTTPTLPRYGPVIQYQIPYGFGARWTKAGEFIGFINP